MNRVTYVLAAAALGVCTQASATTVDLGAIATGQSVGGSLFYSDTGDQIADSWTFTLAQDQETAIIFDSADLDVFYGIADFLVAPAAADWVFNYQPDDNTYTFAGLLPAGTYEVQVSGTASGLLGGSYDVLVGTGGAAVPIPAPLGLFASGVFALGALRRRQAAA